MLRLFSFINIFILEDNHPLKLKGKDLMVTEEQSKPRISFSREAARKVIKKYSLTPPIPIEQILKEQFDFNIVLIEATDNISAFVDLNDHYIGINQNHHNNRQRFTLAHELGHYSLGHKERTYTEYTQTPGKERSNLETEANEFAAELLMPLAVIKKVSKDMNVDSMVNYFQVSKEALFYQLMKHRLI
jgi:Zn-dependent peptidase ImmA (M78 family)